MRELRLQIEKHLQSSHCEAETVENRENAELRVRGVGGKGLGMEC